MAARFRTRGRRPLRWPVMSRCSIQRDWDGLRALLADDVKLHQSLHPLRVGRADVGLFFTLYAKIDGVSLAPAWLEGREVIAVFEDRADPKPSYIMWLEWRDGRISFIRDYRYVSYVTADERAHAGAGDQVRRRRCSVMAARFTWNSVRDTGRRQGLQMDRRNHGAGRCGKKPQIRALPRPAILMQPMTPSPRRAQARGTVALGPPCLSRAATRHLSRAVRSSAGLGKNFQSSRRRLRVSPSGVRQARGSATTTAFPWPVPEHGRAFRPTKFRACCENTIQFRSVLAPYSPGFVRKAPRLHDLDRPRETGSRRPEEQHAVGGCDRRHVESLDLS